FSRPAATAPLTARSSTSARRSVEPAQIRLDRASVAAGAGGEIDDTGDQRAAAEAERIAQDQEPVGQGIERSVAVDVQHDRTREALAEDAVERTVLDLTLPGDDEGAASAHRRRGVELRAAGVGVDLELGRQGGTRAREA